MRPKAVTLYIDLSSAVQFTYTQTASRSTSFRLTDCKSSQDPFTEGGGNKALFEAPYEDVYDFKQSYSEPMILIPSDQIKCVIHFLIKTKTDQIMISLSHLNSQWGKCLILNSSNWGNIIHAPWVSLFKVLQLYMSIFAHSKILGSVNDKVTLWGVQQVFVSPVLGFALFVCLAFSSNRGCH